MSKKRKRQRQEPFYDDSESDYAPTAVIPTPRRKTHITQLVDPAKVAQLMRASNLPVKEPPKEERDLNYHTYTMEEASAMVREYLDSKPKDDPSKA